MSGTYIAKTENVNRFFNDTSKLRMITTRETLELVDLIQSGSESKKIKARNSLVEANFGYMVHFASKYQFLSSLEYGDLIGEATIGMLKAAETFNPEKGKFTTHAKQQMRASLQAAIENNKGTINLPVNHARLISKINKAKNVFYNTNCYYPTPLELSELIDEKEDAIEDCISASQGISSVDKKFGDGSEDGTLIDVYDNPNSLKADYLTDKSDRTLEFQKAISTLSENEAYVIKSLYGLFGESLRNDEDLAKEMGYKTTESIRILKNKALERLSKRCDLSKMF